MVELSTDCRSPAVGGDAPVDAPAESGAGRRRIVFLHLPKTGGTTLHVHISQQVPFHLSCPERFNDLREYKVSDFEQYLFFSGHYDFDEIQAIPGDRYVVACVREPQARNLSFYYFWRRHKPEVIEANDLAGPRAARSLGLLDFLRRGPRAGVQTAMACQLAGAVVPTSDPDTYLVGSCAGSSGARTVLSGREVVERALDNALRLDAVGFVERLDDLYDQVARATGLERATRPLPRWYARAQALPGLDDHVEEEPITTEIQAELDRLTDLDRVVYQELCRRLRPPTRSDGGRHVAPGMVPQ